MAGQLCQSIAKTPDLGFNSTLNLKTYSAHSDVCIYINIQRFTVKENEFRIALNMAPRRRQYCKRCPSSMSNIETNQHGSKKCVGMLYVFVKNNY